ncbi:MAG: hypothetical protein JOZ39_01030 [Chloroflexi bacterium]|nr:hypothetical protein [Chloroflexota bacterium]
MLILGVAGLLAIAAYFTLYLPGARPNANEARAGNVRIWLHAKPHDGSPVAADGSRSVDLDLMLSGEVDDVASINLAADMPTMSHAAASVISITRQSANHYVAETSLDMGGLWRVVLTVNHVSGGSDNAVFDIRV